MGNNTTLQDHGVEPNEFEKESQSLASFPKETILIVTEMEFKNLGQRPGVVLTLEKPVTDTDGESWNKVHSGTERIRSKLEKVKLSGGDTLTLKIIKGSNGNGNWTDVE